MSEQIEEVSKPTEKLNLSINKDNENINLNQINTEASYFSQEEFTFKNLIETDVSNQTLEILKQDNENSDWFPTDFVEIVLDNETIPITIYNNTVKKKCCFPSCCNNEQTIPEKLFYSLPVEKNELNSWLFELGIHLPDENSDNLYYICSDHIATPATSIASKNNYNGFQICPLTNGLSSLTVSEVDENDFKIINETNLKKGPVEKIDTTPAGIINKSFVTSTSPEILCRLCGRCTSNPVSIFSVKNKQDGYNLFDKINFCLPITISLIDKSSKYICSECERKVNISFDLSIMSIETNTKIFKSSSGQKNYQKKMSLKCPFCDEGKITNTPKNSTPKKNINAYEIKELLNNTKPLIDNKNDKVDDIKKYNIAYPLSTQTTVLISNDKKLNENEDKDPESCLDDTKTVVDDDLSCSYCSETICDNESHKYKTSIKKGGKGYYISKRSYTCIQEINPELADNISEDRSDNGRPAKQMKFDSHYENWFECNMCFTTFNYRDSLTNHLNSHRLKRPINNWCDFCQTEFPRNAALQKHISVVHKPEYLIQNKCFKCTGCCRVFTKEDDAYNHASRYCSFILPNEYLSKDNLIHEVYIANVYICEFCNECYSLPTTLHDHRSRKHVTEDYYCSTCDKSFLSRKQLVSHIQNNEHLEDFRILWINRYFVCKYCNKTFLHYSSFLSHIVQHQNDEPYSCRICNRTFTNYDEVSAHRENAHSYQLILQERSSRSYVCHYCQKEFENELEFAKHMRGHTAAHFARRFPQVAYKKI